MHLLHLPLPALDVHRSQRFYARYFGFPADPRGAAWSGRGRTTHRGRVRADFRTADVVTPPEPCVSVSEPRMRVRWAAPGARLAADQVRIAGQYAAPSKVRW